MTDLRTLGGPNSFMSENFPLNDRGEVTGYSDTSTPDPNGEDVCNDGTHLICLPFVWRKGVMTPLPLLGGNNGQAGEINNRGQIVGGAETPNPDTCSLFFLQVEAVIWEKGQVQELPPFPGDPDGFANAINDKDQTVGVSGCAATNTARAVLWPKGANGGVIDLGNLGGTGGNVPFDINNQGQVVGQSDLPGDTTHHAFLWTEEDDMQDLGTLPGVPGSLANGINNKGQVVGFATNAIPDPFNTAPNLYGFGTQMHAFLWEDGAMHDLGTLGGPDSLAFWVNEAGQVAGFSYTSYTPNPLTRVPPYHPFLWENGTMHDLGTIGGTQVLDLDGLNERGQVVGEMTMADEVTAHPFIWDGKNLVDIGTFGGDRGNANALNDAGAVVGYADYPIPCPGGGGQIPHAYLWRKGVKTDLGTVPGIDPLKGGSAAWGINSKTQIVGNSATCDGSVFDAFLWENGSMADLNTLIPANSALHLFNAVYISDRGEITGFGSLPNHDVHTFLLIPCDENDGDSECEDEGEGTAVALGETSQRPNVVLPENVRRMLRQRLGSRYHIGGIVASPRD